MSTARDIVTEAYKLCGIRLPTATEISEAFTTLNNMLKLWSAERLLIPIITEETFTLTVGEPIYTIGTGGTVRPMKIESAYIRDANSEDYPVDVDMSLDEYNRITTKSTQARPTRLYYAPEYPSGKVHFNVTPDAAYTLKLFSWKPLTQFTDLDTTLNMPGEYVEALQLTLAIRLAPTLTVQLDNDVKTMAATAHQTIRNLNKPVARPVAYDSAITRDLAR